MIEAQTHHPWGTKFYFRDVKHVLPDQMKRSTIQNLLNELCTFAQQSNIIIKLLARKIWTLLSAIPDKVLCRISHMVKLKSDEHRR